MAAAAPTIVRWRDRGSVDRRGSLLMCHASRRSCSRRRSARRIIVPVGHAQGGRRSRERLEERPQAGSPRRSASCVASSSQVLMVMTLTGYTVTALLSPIP
jgi:hypothetical protein